MMSTAAVLQQLQDAADDADRLRAIRLLKNQVIGNRHKKVEYYEHGAVRLVVSAASPPASADVLVQCAAALASMTYKYRAAAHGVEACEGIAPLVELLGHDDDRVVEHSARALQSVCEVRRARRLCCLAHWCTTCSQNVHLSLSRCTVSGL